jgi:hypothetical protein
MLALRWGLLGRRLAWVLLSGAVAAACGGSSDLDEPGSSSGAVGGVMPGHGGSSRGAAAGVVSSAGGASGFGAAPIGTGGVWMATGGAVSGICGWGNACSIPNSSCVNGSMVCQCLSGYWQNCYGPPTGGVYPMVTGGAPSRICAWGNACSTPNSYCVDGDVECQCLSGYWQNCYFWGTGGMFSGYGGAPSGVCAPGNACSIPNSSCGNGNVVCQCLSGYWQNCYVPSTDGGVPTGICALGNACSIPNSSCVNGNVVCQCLSGYWQNCYATANTGGRFSGYGGASSGICAPGNACLSPNSYCGNGNMLCQCLSGYWQNCYTTATTGGTFSGYGGARPAVGGARSTGGVSATGGTTGALSIASDGYAVVNAGLYVLHGVVYSFAGGSSSSITLSYNSTSFCARGTVGANPTYVSWAGAGFNVNQTASGAVDPLVLNARVIVLSYTNAAGSQLRLQLNDAASNNWCYELGGSSSSATIPLTSFNTHCWDNSGTYFVPGTAITTIQMVVPGDSVVDRPFDFCMQGVQFQ